MKRSCLKTSFAFEFNEMLLKHELRDGKPVPYNGDTMVLPVGDGVPVPASCFILLVRQVFMCFLLLT